MSSEKSLDIREASEYNIKLSQAVLRYATVFRARRTIFGKVRTASVDTAPAALGGYADGPPRPLRLLTQPTKQNTGSNLT